VNRRRSRTLALGALLLGAGAVAVIAVVGRPRRGSAPVAVYASSVPVASVEGPRAGDRRYQPAVASAPAAVAIPAEDALTDARTWLATRAGRTAFACVDSTGALHGLRVHDRFHSASLVKAMLLTAYLERAEAEHRPLSEAEETLLDPMIRVSDNDAASAIFARVGEAGLQRLAHEAGMTDFATNAAWGYTEVSAADQARFFARLDALLPRRSAHFAHELLAGVTATQRWGIPAAAEPLGWHVLFKGGWLEGIVNQAARLEHGETTLSIAVLSDENPSMGYGIETIEGVTARLLGGGT
jgi:beta-lactamase class A